jgi:hypothetical protein
MTARPEALAECYDGEAAASHAFTVASKLERTCSKITTVTSDRSGHRNILVYIEQIVFATRGRTPAQILPKPARVSRPKEHETTPNPTSAEREAKHSLKVSKPPTPTSGASKNIHLCRLQTRENRTLPTRTYRQVVKLRTVHSSYSQRLLCKEPRPENPPAPMHQKRTPPKIRKIP